MAAREFETSSFPAVEGCRGAEIDRRLSDEFAELHKVASEVNANMHIISDKVVLLKRGVVCCEVPLNARPWYRRVREGPDKTDMPNDRRCERRSLSFHH